MITDPTSSVPESKLLSPVHRGPHTVLLMPSICTASWPTGGYAILGTASPAGCGLHTPYNMQPHRGLPPHALREAAPGSFIPLSSTLSLSFRSSRSSSVQPPQDSVANVPARAHLPPPDPTRCEAFLSPVVLRLPEQGCTLVILACFSPLVPITFVCTLCPKHTDVKNQL